METNAFIHFGLNTFNDREWGYGDTDPATFQPTQLDCRQWTSTLKAAGIKGVILTAKHHDGFCLWPYKGTDYHVGTLPDTPDPGNPSQEQWPVDVVSMLAEACRGDSLRMGLYISPWDRHHPDYGREEYVAYYHDQLRDLLTRYGSGLMELWLDGANGGDGWYGGACETRTIDRRTYYDLPRILAMADSLAPKALIFSDGGPGCRWVGNERGEAGQTNWSMLTGKVYPGYPHPEELATGHADGSQWVPAECDVSIRPGWFYHPEEDSCVKSPEQLLEIYYRSVGRNGLLLINLPPDRNGRIHPTDSANLVGLRKLLERELGHDLLAGLEAKATNVRGPAFTTRALTDGDYHTYWATADSVTTAQLVFTFQQPRRIDRLMLQEYIPLGQRVKAFTADYLKGGTWHPIPIDEATTTIGYKRLLRFAPIEAEAIRLSFVDSRGPLCLNRIAAYDSKRAM